MKAAITGVFTCILAWYAGATDTQERATEKYRELVNNAQDSLSALRFLTPEKPMLKNMQFKELEDQAHSIEPSIRDAYHNWPKQSQYSSQRDYVVRLSIGASAHDAWWSAKMDEWLENDWSIVRSEYVTNPENPYLSTIYIRVARLRR